MKTQSAIRAAFWEAHRGIFRPSVISCGRSAKTGRILYRARTQNEYPATVRCAFVDYVDSLARDGSISETLAHSVTL